MFTLSAPLNLEFQTAEKKIIPIGTSCVVLASGNSAYATEVVQEAKRLLDGNQNPSIVNAVEVTKNAFLHVRANKVREQVLVPMLGPDYLKFEAMNFSLPQYLQFQPNIFQQLAAQMSVFNFGTDMIVAGADGDGARIAYVWNPGTMVWLDKLGYSAIGSGGLHATTRLSLGSQTRDSTLADTVYRVYAAKKAAEVAPGVGSETDLAIIQNGSITSDTTALLTKAEEILKRSRIIMTPDLAELNALLAEEAQ